MGFQAGLYYSCCYFSQDRENYAQCVLEDTFEKIREKAAAALFRKTLPQRNFYEMGVYSISRKADNRVLIWPVSAVE